MGNLLFPLTRMSIALFPRGEKWELALQLVAKEFNDLSEQLFLQQREMA